MTSPLLDALNESQQRAVQIIDGPVLVLAGPGSGKTRLLTHRIAYMIEEVGIDPFHILAVTFTNRAAREMKERLNGLIGVGNTAALTIGTFHSLCARFLRRDIVHLGRERDFVIYDTDDQERLMRRVLKDLRLDEKKNPPRAIRATISSAKNELVDVAEYARLNRTYFDEIVTRCYERYQTLLRENNALDFDDLLFLMVRLFELHPDVLAHYHTRYRYLLVDEYQDTNRAQYVLVRHLAAQHRNLFVVGDDDQCIPAGTPVATAAGALPIEQVPPGCPVVSAAGRGKSSSGRVQRVRQRHYCGSVVQVTLRSGRVLRMTPNHMCFARSGTGGYCVSLLYGQDSGYRIGLTAWGGAADQAEKAWVLQVCVSRAEAACYQQFFAHTYSIPTAALYAEQQGADACNSRAGAERLLADLSLSLAHPHMMSGSTKAVHLTMFGGSASRAGTPWYGHQVAGQETRQFAQMQAAEAAARQLSIAANDADIARCAVLTDGAVFAFQPAAHLRPSMMLPVWEAVAIREDEIVAVTWQDYAGPVYDLDVAHGHNYVAGGVVVHNSIYAWRGADIRNILDFEKDYPDAQVVLLEQNYRSTQAILDTAQAVIQGSALRKHNKRLWTQNDPGVQVTLIEGYDQDDEAQCVADEITRLIATEGYQPGACAVMYRTNAQSRAIEEALIGRGVPYQLVGGTRYYERKEVKDILAYLRLTANPFDSISLDRIINVPKRRIGSKTVEELNRQAVSQGVPVYEVLRQLASDGQQGGVTVFNARTRSALVGFLETIEYLIGQRQQLDLVPLIHAVLERLEFKNVLLHEYGEEEGEERWRNVLELTTIASDYVGLAREAQLPTFLEGVSLVADVDTLDSQTDTVTCITLHQAKGLEYPVVFLVGLEEGVLPHSRSVDERDKLEEERRLLYVGATRARERLYLLRAFRRNMYGRYEISTPSRFLSDIPRELVATGSRRQGMSASGWGAPSPASDTAVSHRSRPTLAGLIAQGSGARFVPGQRVRHGQFGEGTVVSSTLIENDEEVVVNFAEKGEKKLLASFARLQSLD